MGTGQEIFDDRSRSRLVLDQDGFRARLDYRADGGRLVVVHTEVPTESSGHGIAGRLVRAAVTRAAHENLTVVPWCPFARKWLRDHPDLAKTVVIDWSDRPSRPTHRREWPPG